MKFTVLNSLPSEYLQGVFVHSHSLLVIHVRLPEWHRRLQYNIEHDSYVKREKNLVGGGLDKGMPAPSAHFQTEMKMEQRGNGEKERTTTKQKRACCLIVACVDQLQSTLKFHRQPDLRK